MKFFVLTSAAFILLSAVPGVFSSEVSMSMWNYLPLIVTSRSLSSLCCSVPYQENQLRGSPSAIEGDELSVEETFEQVENDEARDKYKRSGTCGTNRRRTRSAEDDRWCTCMNQKCCGGTNKCNSNRGTCNSCGFNCVSSDEDMPWNKGLMESSDCESEWYRRGESICNERCNADHVFIQQE